MNKRFAFLICWLALLLIACGPGPEPPGTPIAEATTVPSPRLGAFTPTGDLIPKELPTTTEIVPNCVGTSEPVVKHPSLTATTGHAAEWQIEGEFGIGLQVSHPILPVVVDLSSAIEATDTQELEQSLARGESWDLPAAPGEIMVYTLSWQELWQPGYVEVTLADQTVRRINVTYRTGIRSDIIDQERQICNGSQPPTASPQLDPTDPTLLPADTPTPVLPTEPPPTDPPTPLPSATTIPSPVSPPVSEKGAAIIGALENDGSLITDQAAVLLFPKTLVDAVGQLHGDEDKRIYARVDDQTGIAEIYDLEPGVYLICLGRAASSVFSGEITIIAGETLRQNFRLPPSIEVGDNCTPNL